MARTFLCLLILLAYVIQGSVAECGRAYQQPLKFEMFADKQSYFLGEPVTLTFRLTNSTTESISAPNGLHLAMFYNNPKVWYRRGSQSFAPLVVNNAGLVNMVFPPEELLPGKSKLGADFLIYAASPPGPVLNEPGRHEFLARYVFRDTKERITTLESNIVRIIVRELPKSELQAFNRWNDPELLDFLQGNVGFVPEEKVRSGALKAAAFLDEFSNTVYARTAHKVLLDYLESQGPKRLSEKEQVVYERLKLVQ